MADLERRLALVNALESLWDCVWRCEREWELDDRIALGVKNALAHEREAAR